MKSTRDECKEENRQTFFFKLQRAFDIWLRQLFLSMISIDNGYDHLLHVCVHNKNVHVDKPTWEFLK